MADQNLKIQIAAIDKTQAAFASINRSLSGLKGQIASVFAVAGLVSFAKHALDAADEVQKASQRLGVSAEFFQKYQFAAGQADISQQEFVKSLDNLQKKAAEARRGTAGARDSFYELEVGLYNLDGTAKTTEQLFMDINKAMVDSSRASVAASLANDIYGKSGTKIYGAIKQNIQAFNELAQSAPKVFTQEEVDLAAEFNDKMDVLQRTVSGTLQKAFLSFGPQLLDAATNMKTLVDKIIELSNEYPNIMKITGAIATMGIALSLVGPKAAIAAGAIATFILYAKEIKEIFGVATEEVARHVHAVVETTGAYERATLQLDGFRNGIKIAGFSLDEVGKNAVMNFENALLGLANGTVTVKDAFKSMAASIINDLIRMYIRYTVTMPLFEALFGKTTQAPAPIEFADVQATQASFRAAGGPVSANSPYIVGEKGPEMFIPNASGTIIPNNQLGGGGGGTTIVNQTFQISTGVSQTVRAEIQSMMPRITEATKAAVADAKRRGGTYGKMMA